MKKLAVLKNVSSITALARRVALAAVVSAAAAGLTGCASTGGGLFGRLQAADEVLAARYGLPAEAVREARAALGIPDARTLPGPERVLPEGLALQYDMLDGSNQVVDVSLYHRAAIPRIVQAGNAAPTIFDSAAADKGTGADLNAILKLIRKKGTP